MANARGPRPRPFVPDGLLLSAGHEGPAVSPSPQPAPAPSEGSRSPRRQLQEVPSGPPIGFPLGLAAYRNLPESQQAPALRQNLVWALHVYGEEVTEELVETLLQRAPNALCSCFSNKGRLRGAVLSVTQTAAAPATHAPQPQPEEPRPRSSGRGRGHIVIGSRHSSSWRPSSRAPARWDTLPPASSASASSGQWYPTLGARLAIGQAPRPATLPADGRAHTPPPRPEDERRAQERSPRPAGPFGKRPRRGTPDTHKDESRGAWEIDSADEAWDGWSEDYYAAMTS